VVRCNGLSHAFWFDQGVYHKYPAPPWLRRISTLEAEYVATRWLQDQDLGDALIVNGYDLALAARHPRMAVALDVTPALLMRMKRPLRGRLAAPLRWLSHVRFANFAANVRAWLPMSAKVRLSLIEDYGVDPERCFVTRAPQPVIDPVTHEASGRLLFVGGDFVRKGGDLLLAAMAHLPDCELTVVSNDPAAKALAGRCARAKVIQGIKDPAKLADVYRASDLLVLPTRYDCYSHVICEAAAFGIPSIATRVGGVGELLDESGGKSIPEDCSPPQLARIVKAVLTNGYGQRALTSARFARDCLSLGKFDEAISAVLRALEPELEPTGLPLAEAVLSAAQAPPAVLP